ncbi:MAG: hypothetical protein JJ870_11615 [Winogradskyella sp.]|nr:hypothetical protein [Winogradskyella sp.]
MGALGFFGFFALILGWIGIASLDIFIGLPWLANLLFFAALIFYKMNKNYKIVLSVLTIILGLFTLGINEIPADEGGAYYSVSVGVGFLFWMSSFIVLLISSIKQKLTSPNNQNALHP